MRQIIGILLFVFCAQSTAASFPVGNSRFYYQLGGGQDFPPPASSDVTTIPLSISGSSRLGYHCGSFDPSLTVTNTLNDIKGSFSNIPNSVIQHITPAIGALPMLILARANPVLYNLLNNNLIGAHDQFKLSMKSCQAMKQDIAQGDNPYHDWLTMSVGNDWKQAMSIGGDLNIASKQAEQDAGANGVPWVNHRNAGGNGQEPIRVLADSTQAGYNVLLQRDPMSKAAVHQTPDNSQLAKYWQTPEQAAHWVTAVLGDQEITTRQNAGKDANVSQPGQGLLPMQHQLSEAIYQKLQLLVADSSNMEAASLEAVSAPGVLINREVITSLQNRTSNEQNILLHKIAQEVASARIIDQALTAKQMLHSGAQVPEVLANGAAQRRINSAVKRLDAEINDLLFNLRVRRELSANTISMMLAEDLERQQDSLRNPQFIGQAPKLLDHGALSRVAP